MYKHNIIVIIMPLINKTRILFVAVFCWCHAILVSLYYSSCDLFFSPPSNPSSLLLFLLLKKIYTIVLFASWSLVSFLEFDTQQRPTQILRAVLVASKGTQQQENKRRFHRRRKQSRMGATARILAIAVSIPK